MTESWEEVGCILCGDTIPNRVIWQDIERGNLVKCLGCGLIFRTPRRPECYLKRHFTEEWTEARPAYFLQNYRQKNLRTIANWILNRRCTPGVILDVGSSYGTLLEMFPDNWQRFGVEPSTIAWRIAKKRLPALKVINATLDEALLPEGFFDVITMVDTVYYLSRPLEDFGQLHRLLKPGGLVLVEAPNFANRGKVYRWMSHRFDNTWMYFYTPSSLTALLRRAGLAVIDRFGLPGHQVGSKNYFKQFASWLEFYSLEAFYSISGCRVDLVPHFVLVAQRF